MTATIVPTIPAPAPLVQTGFTQVANRVLSDPRLSAPARLLYALLKMHAWQSAVALPGQVRLGALLGVHPRQVRRYLAELIAAGLVVVRRRGRNLTNEYYLAEAPAPLIFPAAISARAKKPKKSNCPSRRGYVSTCNWNSPKTRHSSHTLLMPRHAFWATRSPISSATPNARSGNNR